MPDLIDFLRDRITEDEAWLTTPTARRMIGRKMVDVPIGRLPAYVERDRKRWAAECEAKRRIVGMYERAHDAEATDRHLWAAYREERTAFQRALEALALVYADHSDFDPSWRVE